jgi:hypothetical protein
MYRPIPIGTDYTNGYLIRYFSKRVNAVKAIEVSPDQSNFIDTNLYQTVQLTWKISGPAENLVTNKVIQKFGVRSENLNEIQRVKQNTGIDLSSVLINPLELWRGY